MEASGRGGVNDNQRMMGGGVEDAGEREDWANIKQLRKIRETFQQ